MKRKLAMLGALMLVIAAIGGGVAAASGGGAQADADTTETDVPISGADLAPASDAALAHLGEGTVSDTEVGDEESHYEVEVTLEDGSEVDVQLDREFNVVGTDVEDGDGGHEADESEEGDSHDEGEPAESDDSRE